MGSVFYGHQRQFSGNEQLITSSATNNEGESNNEPVYCNPTSSNVSCVELSLPTRPTTVPDMRFSTLSDCSSYYGLPDTPNENQARHIFKDPYLRANCREVCGSLALTFFGILLIGIGVFLTFVPNEIDMHGWMFLIIGILFLIPGCYHLYFILLAAICGRNSLENLPTFNRPT